MAMLDTVKLAMRISATENDAEISSLIEAACKDMGIVGVSVTSGTDDALLTRAIITYTRLHFGTPDDYDHLKASYDEQKAQLITATGYGGALT